jgi:hypothetical protein
MSPVRKSAAVDYRDRAARLRQGARCGASLPVCDALLRLAAKYDELADKPAARQDDDDMVVFRRVRRSFRSGAMVLYYLN